LGQTPRFSNDREVYQHSQATLKKKQEAITRALHILSLLRETRQKQ